ncbi:TPA: hypothetical protein N0F65_007590 [Lagenidium giganteum]|uniref:Uncharacterized protein n=1 Tax=Lagenidium giganteum TaxID=4803 RepID=A0AAV2ZD90_9STRA|nr:TPA: hypothetical protein N0F65_007590 [Lagenidium giganteum]
MLNSTDRRRQSKQLHNIAQRRGTGPAMQAFEDESRRVLKKQRLCVQQVESQLDGLLREVEVAKQRLVEKQHEYRRKKNRLSPTRAATTSESNEPRAASPLSEGTAPEVRAEEANVNPVDEEESAAGNERPETSEEEEDQEMEEIVQEFIKRVRLLNVEKNVAHELKTIHVTLSKYVKLVDKTFCNDITRICKTTDWDHRLICQLVAEYLYQDGQIDAADAFCKEAQVVIPAKNRECFVELHTMLTAIRRKDLVPALTWARTHRKELQKLHIDLEFELVRLKYLETLEHSKDVMDAVKYASDELSTFHETHSKDVGRLLSCVLFKDRLADSPYKDLFHNHRWEDITNSIVRACCKLRRLPHRPYLQTCLSAGVRALPAMRKLASVLDNNKWESMEELPVEVPLPNQHRFHTVFACPVSKEESTPENPPMLLKCGHVICKSCVKKISYNFSRRFKCPTCPMEQMESETRELFF